MSEQKTISRADVAAHFYENFQRRGRLAREGHTPIHRLEDQAQSIKDYWEAIAQDALELKEWLDA